MDTGGHGPPEQDLTVSVPRGGPIFDPDLVSPITSAPQFQLAVLEELQSLMGELSSVSILEFEDEFVVDDLKVLTEEELVERALKEAFKDGEKAESSSQNLEEDCSERRIDDSGRLCNKSLESSSKESRTTDTCGISNGFPCATYENGHSGKIGVCDTKKSKKKGRAFDRDTRAAELEQGSYVAKVEELARIKQKQDDDKAAARLHSLNSRAKVDELAISASEKIEKMRSLRCITTARKAKASRTDEPLPVCYPETIISIEIYHSEQTHVKTQELLVLGSQTLTQLKDNIHCKMDHLMQKEGLYDSSGYFLIEDVFYNDLRDRSAINYSEPIFQWLRDCKKEALTKWEYIAISAELHKKQKSLLGSELISRLPEFRAFDMHKARFCDLQFRLGCGYLYCHQGDCRHIIVIRDMRLIHPEDVQNRVAYPILTFQHKHRHLKCSICNIYLATKITVDDKWARENPSYFCDNCYFLLHYNEDGSLLYNEFTVYDCYHE